VRAARRPIPSCQQACSDPEQSALGTADEAPRRRGVTACLLDVQVEDKERKVAFTVICLTIFLSGFLYTYLIPLVPSYHLITGAYFSTAEVALLFASYSFGETHCGTREARAPGV
jgi:hypothetical protein